MVKKKEPQGHSPSTPIIPQICNSLFLLFIPFTSVQAHNINISEVSHMLT